MQKVIDARANVNYSRVAAGHNEHKPKYSNEIHHRNTPNATRSNLLRRIKWALFSLKQPRYV